MKDYSYELLDLLEKYKGDAEAALRGETSPWCLYAFSPLRENLFEWLEMKKNDRVLQVGSDYGSCTGLFSERAGEVVVLDQRDENLEVNRRRHGEKGNLCLIRGELPKADAESLGWKEYKGKERAAEELDALYKAGFDYVILSTSENSRARGPSMLSATEKSGAADLLERAAALVRPGGKLLAAAENESGVRYFMGAEPFEHSFLEVEFRGLFEDLKEKFGGTAMLYYPVPDYRYPATIYSDDYLPQTGDVTNISARLDGPGLWFGNEEKAMANACRNGDFAKFTNSFLGMWEKGKA